MIIMLWMRSFFLALSNLYIGHHINHDLSYSVYHEDCKTRGRRAESISQLALVQAKHGGYSEARKTLDILVQLYNQISCPSNFSSRCQLNDVIGARDTLSGLRESLRQGLLKAEIKEFP